MKMHAVRTTMLLIAALSIAAVTLQAAPSLPVQKPPVTPMNLTGPMPDPTSAQGQWFTNLVDGTEEYRPLEFHDNLQDYGGGHYEHEAIVGRVQNVQFGGAGQPYTDPIVKFQVEATIRNDTYSVNQETSASTNSHGEVRAASTNIYIGSLLDTKLTVEFAIADTNTLPAAFTGPYRHPGYPSWIVAENEDQLAWYCWNPLDPPQGDSPGGYFVPTWDFGDIPINQSATKMLTFIVDPPMDTSDPRYYSIYEAQTEGVDIFLNRTTSLKISTWLDDIGADFGWPPYPQDVLRSSDVSVFHYEEPPYEPTHKMHWPQLPDPNGWDVRACLSEQDGKQKVLADDFLCTSNGPITKITFWGSFLEDEYEWDFPYQGITNFHLSLHKDIPDPDEQGPEYSKPMVPAEWERNLDPYALPPGWTIDIIPEIPSSQGWYDPNTGEYEEDNHTQYFRYEITIPPDEAFIQTAGNIYWLDVSVQMEDPYFMWGWKTSVSPHYNDDAVWADLPVNDPLQWNELVDPIESNSLDLAFVIDGGEEEPQEEYDFGDAPDTGQGTSTGNYETKKLDNGAYHTIVANAPFFDDGSFSDQPDPEPDGQPDPNAKGDDNDILYPSAGDDEDGIAWPTPLVAGQNSSVNITVDDGWGGGGAGGAYVYAWIDFNGDGDWTDSGEQIQNGWLVQGLHSIPFTVPASATTGPTFARFRITSSQTALLPTGGPAPDGEVEDHEVNIEEPETFDWGDAPDGPYRTYSANNGANHLIVQGMRLGPNIDSETDGQPNANATGDDNVGIPDDEDGVSFTPLNPSPGQPMGMSVNVVGSGYLNVWIDWANDGSWAEAGDHVWVDVPVSTSIFSGYFTVPTNTPWGTQLMSRTRFSSVSNLTYKGSAPDGEVEDHAFTTKEPPDHELGDAPDSSNSFGTNMTAYPIGGPAGTVANFPTVYGSGSPAPVGPIHWLPLGQAHLGFQVSREEEADSSPDEDVVNNILPLLNQPNNDGDDDALASSGPLSLPHCRSTTLTYDATWTAPLGSSMWVNVWFDWNRDGDWNDTITCPDGSTVPEWAVQNDFLPIPLPQTPPWPKYINATTPAFTAWHPSVTKTPIWMRMTLAEKKWPPVGAIAGGEGPTNGYLYGETEDYYITNYELADEFDFGDAPDSPYPTLLPSGARHYVVPGFKLGSLIDYETNGLPNITATGDDLDGVDDEDGVTMGSLIRGSNTVANITLTSGAAGGVLDAWVDFNGNGTWAPAEKIFSGVALLPGNTNLTFSVPSGAALGTNYARFRLSSGGVSTPSGAATDGEVEDYQVILYQPVPSPDITITNIYVTASNTTATVAWNSQSGITYQMQSTTNLTLSNSWMNAGGIVLGPVNWQTNSAAPTNQFYRIIAPWTP